MSNDSPRKRAGLCALASAVALLLVGSHPAWSGEDLSEDRVQATMLLQVIKFVDWPKDREPAQMRICVVPGGRFHEALEAAAKSESWRGRPVVVSALDRISDSESCPVLFVAAATEREMQSMLDRRGWPALTVANREGFARRGGMVNFIHDGGRIGLEMNPSAGEQAGIRFSSKLLRLARIVSTGVMN